MLIDLDAPPAPVRRAWWWLTRNWAEWGLIVSMITAVVMIIAVRAAPAERSVTFRWTGGTGFGVVVGSRRVADVPSGTTLRAPSGSYLGLYVVATKAATPASCTLVVAGMPPVTATASGVGAVAACEWRVP